MRHLFVRLATGALVTSLSLCAVEARAQEDIEVAAKAFAEGQQAQLRGDFVRAAELFEIADRSVPSAAAVRSAIRTRGAAGQSVRAATLALQALHRYPEDAETRAVADSALQRYAPTLVRVHLRCSEPCTATVDGALVGAGPLSSLEFFVSPGSHVVRGSWSGREPVSRTLQNTAGESVNLTLEAPPAAGPSPLLRPIGPGASTTPLPTRASVAVSPVLAPSPSPPPAVDSHGKGMSPAVFWVGTALTAGTGALAVWSGLETLSARDDYEAHPTRDGYEDGVRLERRTNLLIGGAAALGVTTLAIGLFGTDWGGSSDVAVELGARRATVALRGVLP